jgi:D-alanyl-D-alanine carboxypeptidase
VRISLAVRKLSLALIILTLASVVPAHTQSTLTPALRSAIDDTAQHVLKATGVPSASVAVVQDGKIAYVQAYGSARLSPQTNATTAMRYSIGSISKQFTAAAILMLAEEGKLSLDDPVSKYVPGLTQGDQVTIRQLLSHTSGYQDFWPQDYVPPLMLKPISADQIMDMWARKPLDFQPGMKWQYSNTNYVIAGVIVEKISGMPLLKFLSQRVFTPLEMKSVSDTDANKLPPTDPTGYMSYALGPPRPAPKEGRGWMFAAGELAMTAEDLAKWDISIINQSVMKPASYRDMETKVVLKDGVGTRYGLGMFVTSNNGHRTLEHGGEVSGFVAENIVLPDDKIAVVVLTNQDASEAAGGIGRQVVAELIKAATPQDPKTDAMMRQVYDGLQQGKIDRTLFTDNANAYFTDQALKDYADSLDR